MQRHNQGVHSSSGNGALDDMAEKYESLGEVSVALGGVKDTIANYAKGVGLIIALAGGLTAWAGNHLWSLNTTTARIDERTIFMDKRLADMEALMKSIKADTQQASVDLKEVKTSTKQASLNPKENAFPGWAGAEVVDPSKVQEFIGTMHAFPTNAEANKAWIFLPTEKQ
ncbi:hypothetical protein [Rhizobium sp. P007]|uniref:hypothetical protein n=1 Tax=Rhizobium sp. P007 TaxID=285908 RepID=UPI0011590812|nr:hypothetical protein [Rhizobium sp. P007]CAD7033896.1 hypothetical protein RP007_04177 [Rhizobium sp. P007]